jgi:hypothetical protein
MRRDAVALFFCHHSRFLLTESFFWGMLYLGGLYSRRQDR